MMQRKAVSLLMALGLVAAALTIAPAEVRAGSLDYIPGDAHIFIQINVDALKADSQMAPLLQTIDQQMKMGMQQNTGQALPADFPSISDLKTVSIGVNVPDTASDDPAVFAAVDSGKALSALPAMFEANGGQTQELDGRKFFLNTNDDSAMTLVGGDKVVLVSDDVASVNKMIAAKGGQNAGLRKDVVPGAGPTGASLVYVHISAPQSMGQQAQAAQMQATGMLGMVAMNAQTPEEQEAIMKAQELLPGIFSAKGYDIFMGFDDVNMTITIRGMMNDQETAAGVKQFVDTMIEQSQKTNPQAGMLMQNSKVTAENGVFDMQMNVPKAMVMGMLPMMLGGMMSGGM